jgi:hypothetical protein
VCWGGHIPCCIDAISLGKTNGRHQLTEANHRQVEGLFEAFEKGASDKSEVASEVCRLLSIHAQLEEEIFYPAAREALGEGEGWRRR